MNTFDTAVEEFSIEALEVRFEMEAVAEPDDPDWKSTCTLEN